MDCSKGQEVPFRATVKSWSTSFLDASQSRCSIPNFLSSTSPCSTEIIKPKLVNEWRFSAKYTVHEFAHYNYKLKALFTAWFFRGATYFLIHCFRRIRTKWESNKNGRKKMIEKILHICRIWWIGDSKGQLIFIQSKIFPSTVSHSKQSARHW